MAFFSRAKRSDAKPVSKQAKTIESKRTYRGVEVIPHPRAHCAAVEEIAGRRILADEAPQLPLPACDQAECKCRYAQYRDRRAGSRRDADVGISGIASLFNVDNGRTDSAGRRVDDEEDR